jgi:predicted nucleotidyltransferase
MDTHAIVEILVHHYPDVQTVYLFGSSGTGLERPDSDIDLALLLPYRTAVANRSLAMTSAWSELMALSGREVDLINLRLVNTVFQNEVLNTARVIHGADDEARRIFEMEALSAYQKLNDERREILEDFFRTRRAYNV